MRWDASLYQRQHGFVAEYGKALLAELPRTACLEVLDIGCGTGELTAEIAGLGHRVLGIDNSVAMVRRAREHFPQVPFASMDALALPFVSRFDVAFSNAVFHWIADQEALLGGIFRALKPGGRLLCEFGAQGNVLQLRQAFAAALQAPGATFRDGFFLPSSQDYTRLLESAGFAPLDVFTFDRPTRLAGGEAGLSHWVRQFFAADLVGLDAGGQADVLARMEAALRPTLWDGTQWVADYRRIRVLAEKRP